MKSQKRWEKHALYYLKIINDSKWGNWGLWVWLGGNLLLRCRQTLFFFNNQDKISRKCDDKKILNFFTSEVMKIWISDEDDFQEAEFASQYFYNVFITRSFRVAKSGFSVLHEKIFSTTTTILFFSLKLRFKQSQWTEQVTYRALEGIQSFNGPVQSINLDTFSQIVFNHFLEVEKARKSAFDFYGVDCKWLKICSDHKTCDISQKRLTRSTSIPVGGDGSKWDWNLIKSL